MNLAMHGVPTADNNSLRESKDYRKTPALFEVQCLVYMCNSCSSEVVGRLEEHNNSREQYGAVEAGAVQFQASMHIHAIMSCVCITSRRHVAVLVCQGLSDFHVFHILRHRK